MSKSAVKALLKTPHTYTKMGLREQFLMIFLYDTGGRIQEVLDVDLRIDKTPTVTLHGKGDRVRVVPWMKGTVTHLQNYMATFHKGENQFSSGWLFYVERKETRSAMIQRGSIFKSMLIWQERPAQMCLIRRYTRAMHLY